MKWSSFVLAGVLVLAASIAFLSLLTGLDACSRFESIAAELRG